MRDSIFQSSEMEIFAYPAAIAGFLILAIPQSAFALQVGCFVTAVLLGFMLLLSLSITLTLKSVICCRLGGLQKTPWKCVLSLTIIELFLFMLAFAVTRTGFSVTLLVYLPFAAVINGLILTKPLRNLAGAASLERRIALYALQALSLPAAIQIVGLVWSALTGVIESTEFHA